MQREETHKVETEGGTEMEMVQEEDEKNEIEKKEEMKLKFMSVRRTSHVSALFNKRRWHGECVDAVQLSSPVSPENENENEKEEGGEWRWKWRRVGLVKVRRVLRFGRSPRTTPTTTTK